MIYANTESIPTLLTAVAERLARRQNTMPFTTDMDLFFEHADELERLREAGTRYASTLVEVTRLAFPEFLVEIEATATS